MQFYAFDTETYLIEPGRLAPKLVWASAGAKKAVASPPKQSLLEIQKEELIRSCENSSRDSSRNDSERSSSIVGV